MWSVPTAKRSAAGERGSWGDNQQLVASQTPNAVQRVNEIDGETISNWYLPNCPNCHNRHNCHNCHNCYNRTAAGPRALQEKLIHLQTCWPQAHTYAVTSVQLQVLADKSSTSSCAPCRMEGQNRRGHHLSGQGPSIRKTSRCSRADIQSATCPALCQLSSMAPGSLNLSDLRCAPALEM